MWVAEERQEVNSSLLHGVSPNKAKFFQDQADCDAEWDDEYGTEGYPQSNTALSSETDACH